MDVNATGDDVRISYPSFSNFEDLTPVLSGGELSPPPSNSVRERRELCSRRSLMLQRTANQEIEIILPQRYSRPSRRPHQPGGHVISLPLSTWKCR